ncbi:MAG TPA: hypothetical protein VIZ43_00205 [Trebonia sp.]
MATRDGRSQVSADAELTLSLDDGEIYLRQDGPRDAPALLLIHGNASSARPLLVIFGQEDRRWRSSSAADYRAVPGARVEMLPGLGHTPILEDPARTASCLLAFTAAEAARPH